MSGSAYSSELRLTFDDGHEPSNGGLRPELADVGRLARRGMRAVVGAARAGERPRLSRMLAEHLGPGATTSDVVEETWPGYDHVNVQAGLDAWLDAAGRTSTLVGVVSQHGQPVGLTELLADDGPHDPFGPRPGNAATVNLACGPDGAARPCVRSGLYLVSDGPRRTALLLRGASPEFGRNEVSAQLVSSVRSSRRGRPPRSARRRGSATCSEGRCSPSGRRSSATGRPCCSSTAGRR